jgi:hypothetical protein
MTGYLRNSAWVLLTIVVSFWVGALCANIFPGFDEKPLKLLVDTLVAIGTIGAVMVALWQMSVQRDENQSRINLTEARRTLESAVNDFLSKKDQLLRPIGDRRHWLTFARGVSMARSFGTQITNPTMRRTWEETEHYWRERVYDVLSPVFESYPADYYGYMDEADFHKNLAFSPGDREPVAEKSAAFVYRWVKWPDDRPDPLNETPKFSDEELERMEGFGPRGCAAYFKKLRTWRPPPRTGQGP